LGLSGKAGLPEVIAAIIGFSPRECACPPRGGMARRAKLQIGLVGPKIAQNLKGIDEILNRIATRIWVGGRWHFFVPLFTEC